MNTNPKCRLCGRRYWVTLFSAPPGFCGRCAADIEAKQRERRLIGAVRATEKAGLSAAEALRLLGGAFANLAQRGVR